MAFSCQTRLANGRTFHGYAFPAAARRLRTPGCCLLWGQRLYRLPEIHRPGRHLMLGGPPHPWDLLPSLLEVSLSFCPGRWCRYPWTQQRPIKPDLKDLINKKDGLVKAFRDFDYRLREIGEFLNVHYSVISRRIKTIENNLAKNKTWPQISFPYFVCICHPVTLEDSPCKYR